MKKHEDTPTTDADDRTAIESDKELTPPHGDELRDEVTFGRTDRHANLDDEQATRKQPGEGPQGGKDSGKPR